MMDLYFSGGEVREGFSREFVSLFNGWLGETNLHLLDDVPQSEWEKFNRLLRLVFARYEIQRVDVQAQSCSRVWDVNQIITTYEEDMGRSSFQFTRIIIPELEAVYTEEWDYTWILWHRHNGTLEAIDPMISEAGLFHFHE